MAATETTRRYLPDVPDILKLALKAGVSERTVRRWYDMQHRTTWGNRSRLRKAATALGVRLPDGPLPGHAPYPNPGEQE